MKTTLSLLLITFLSLNVGAQTWEKIGDSFNGFSNSIITDSNGKLYSAGQHSSQSKTYVASWDSTEWNEVGTFPFGFAGVIDQLIFDNENNLYAVGNFRNTSLEYYVAKFNGSTWSQVGTGFEAEIHTVYAISADDIYIGGYFKNSSNKTYISHWNGTNWSEVGSLNGNNRIWTVTGDKEGNIYAGGNFKNSSNKNYVAKWDGNSWSDMGLTNVNGAITEIKVKGNNLYASSNAINIWNGSNWESTTSLNGGINDFAIDSEGKFYAVGTFYIFEEGNLKFYIAMWDGQNWKEVDPTTTVSSTSQIYSIHIDKSGNVYSDETVTTGENHIIKYTPVIAGLNHEENTLLSAYPNPTENQININLTEKSNVTIFNILGQSVFSGKENEGIFSVSLENLENGMYTVQVEGNINSYNSFKVIKK